MNLLLRLAHKIWNAQSRIVLLAAIHAKIAAARASGVAATFETCPHLSDVRCEEMPAPQAFKCARNPQAGRT